MPIYCIETGCPESAGYNYPNERGRLYCKKHAKDGMIVAGQYCRTCIERGERIYASFNYPNEISPIYCASHIKEGMVNVKKLRKGASKLRETLATAFPE